MVNLPLGFMHTRHFKNPLHDVKIDSCLCSGPASFLPAAKQTSDGSRIHKPYVIDNGILKWIHYHSLWIQTLSQKLLDHPSDSKLYPKHLLKRYLDP